MSNLLEVAELVHGRKRPDSRYPEWVLFPLVRVCHPRPRKEIGNSQISEWCSGCQHMHIPGVAKAPKD